MAQLSNKITLARARKKFTELSRWRVDVPLIGTIDGSNRIFQVGPGGVPEIFVHTDDGMSIMVTHNGRRLFKGIDFDLAESGGPGTGYDTISFISLIPDPIHTCQLRGTYITSLDCP